MTLGSIVRWLVTQRLICTVLGHRWRPGQILGYRLTPEDGYRCDRCDAQTRTLFLWQEETGDDQ